MDIEKRIKKTSGCWLWTGTIKDSGYGEVEIRVNGKRKSRTAAHRFVYEQLIGPIPDGKILMHICDNPPCVNPKHLRIGTIGDNNRDTASKRRFPKGLKHWNGRLTDKQVETIRNSDKTQYELADEYGINQGYVSQLQNRLRRK